MMKSDQGWLQISTSGFAALNQSRPPEHLVKELIQNSFDAIGDAPGQVRLDYGVKDGSFMVACHDTGAGIEDLAAMRVVYLTFKTDSHLKRGRFGRGFKEILSVARSAVIASGGNELHFLHEDGEQVTKMAPRIRPLAGTSVVMQFDWPAETADAFETYFSTILVPANIELVLNGNTVATRPPEYTVDASLSTEIYHADSHSWRKPRRKTSIGLVAAKDDEEPFIYEMGIAVAAAEWSVPFHANVMQRVPMNPNRDALASGYARKVHAACLPVLLPDLGSEAVTADWVGSAGADCDATIQQEILTKAFGDSAVRSVPAMGKRDFDDDAERIGATIVKTSQMSSGFRQMAKAHLPSAREKVSEEKEQLAKDVAGRGFSTADVLSETDERQNWILRRGGPEHVDQCVSFAVWFCQMLVDSTDDRQPPVTGNLAIGSRPQVFGGTSVSTFMAYWSSNNQLTLALDVDCFWTDPMGPEALAILVHEAAHARNMHHGKGFNDEVERLAGVAASAMFASADDIRRRWPGLAVSRGQSQRQPWLPPRV